MASFWIFEATMFPPIPGQQPLMSTFQLLGPKAAYSESTTSGAFLLGHQMGGLAPRNGPNNDGQSEAGASMRVLWTISGYKLSDGASWGEEEARRLLFKPLDIDANQITFDGKTCRDVIFQREKLNAKEYLDRVYRTTPQALGIEQSLVEVIKTNCDLPGFQEYIRLRDRRLIIYLNGVFFYFKPALNY